MEKSGQSTKESIRGLFTVPAMLLYVMLLTMGSIFGIKDTYFSIYLQEELGGSAQLLCKDCILYSTGAMICNRYPSKQVNQP